MSDAEKPEATPIDGPYCIENNDDPDHWTAERLLDETGGGCRIFDADDVEISPNQMSIVWFNVGTGWVGQIDPSRFVGEGRPLNINRYKAPLRIQPA